MKKMIGVSCLQPNPDVALMHAAGIEWVRAMIPYPFADASRTVLADKYLAWKKKIDFWR